MSVCVSLLRGFESRGLLEWPGPLELPVDSPPPPPRRISGATQESEQEPPRPLILASSSFSNMAEPKSPRCASRLVSSINTFSGFISQWMMPRSWQNFTAAATCLIIFAWRRKRRSERRSTHRFLCYHSERRRCVSNLEEVGLRLGFTEAPFWLPSDLGH